MDARYPEAHNQCIRHSRGPTAATPNMIIGTAGTCRLMAPSLYIAASDTYELALRVGRHYGFFHGVIKLILIVIIALIVVGVLIGVMITRAIGRRLRGRGTTNYGEPYERDPRGRR